MVLTGQRWYLSYTFSLVHIRLLHGDDGFFFCPAEPCKSHNNFSYICPGRPNIWNFVLPISFLFSLSFHSLVPGWDFYFYSHSVLLLSYFYFYASAPAIALRHYVFGFGTFTWTQGWTDDLKSTFLKPQLMRRMFAARCTPAGTWLEDLSQLVLLQLINECTSLFLYFLFSVFFVCLFVCWCFFLSASCPRSSSQTRPLTASLSQMLFTVSSCCCCAVWTCDMAELELLRGFINSGSFPELKNPPQWQGRNK